jgi:predicted GNAT family acetyltransferase
MYRSRMNVQNMLSKVPDSPLYAAETVQDGERRLVSAALLNIISTEGGLIGGVYTRPECRGKGWAARCTAAVAHALQSQQRLPCLFYENPVAGRVYSRLGFREVAFWAVLYLHLP